MKLNELIIENFRNFKNSRIKLDNKNVVFGMNDVGKTNLLYSLRYLLDRKVRGLGFNESDYYQRDTQNDINITLSIDISDHESDNDSQNLISKVGGARSSNMADLFYIRLKGAFDETEALGIPELFWGSDLESLETVNQNGNFSDLDKVFNVLYIDPAIDLENIFSKNRRRLFNQKNLSQNDIGLHDEITGLTSQINSKISSMDIIKGFQSDLTDEYQKLKNEDIGIELQSEMALKGVFSDINPYIKRNKDDTNKLYPTSGDGRKKLLSYSLLNYLTKEYDSNKITIYLIEEPENSLHRSMQIALSNQLFSNNVYNYFILSTHSPELLYEMDDAVLIRVYSRDKTDCESYLYEVPENFSDIKKELNEALTTALFADKVLLIEGPSEKALFEKVLSVVSPKYELDGGYVLLVDGIKFEPYFNTLKNLGISPIIKTDNDLKAKSNNKISFDLIGFNRCLKILGKENLSSVEIDYSITDNLGDKKYYLANKKTEVRDKKISLFQEHSQIISELKMNNIFLSKIDLENDLMEVIPEKLTEVFGENAVEKLQSKKLLYMLELIKKLTNDDCKLIFHNERFESLKKLVCKNEDF